MTKEGPTNSGKLYLVGTPIGNLADITLRALDVLRTVDRIACEDTRQSLKLLKRHEIPRKPLVSLHQHNEAGRSEQLLEKLLSGETIALISDAGMPLVSDPGLRFLHRCLLEGVCCEVIPGPSAVATAVVGSGFPADSYFFGGFLPNKSGQRERVLRSALEFEHTSVFFESPHRLLKTLTQISELESDRQLCVGRELTKKFEDYRRGSAAELLEHYTGKPPKGEITLVIAPTKLPKWMGMR